MKKMMMMLRRGSNTRDKLVKNLFHSSSLQVGTDPPYYNYTKVGGDWNEYARVVYDNMLESRPLPPREEFNKLLRRLLKYDLHPAVISLNRQMVLHGIPRDEFSLATLLFSYSQLYQYGFGLSVMVNHVKMGFQFDIDYHVRSLFERKRTMEVVHQSVPKGHSLRSYLAIIKLMGSCDEDFNDDYTSIDEFFKKSSRLHDDLQQQVISLINLVDYLCPFYCMSDIFSSSN